MQAELSAEDLDQARVEDEFGDLLFTMVQLGRHLRVNSEFALRRANLKFRSRFNSMEEHLGGVDELRGSAAEKLEEAWQHAKSKE